MYITLISITNVFSDYHWSANCHDTYSVHSFITGKSSGRTCESMRSHLNTDSPSYKLTVEASSPVMGTAISPRMSPRAKMSTFEPCLACSWNDERFLNEDYAMPLLSFLVFLFGLRLCFARIKIVHFSKIRARTCSGAMYLSVPVPFVLEMSISSPSRRALSATRPRSQIFTRLSAVTRMFCGWSIYKFPRFWFGKVWINLHIPMNLAIIVKVANSRHQLLEPCLDQFLISISLICV